MTKDIIKFGLALSAYIVVTRAIKAKANKSTRISEAQEAFYAKRNAVCAAKKALDEAWSAQRIARSWGGVLDGDPISEALIAHEQALTAYEVARATLKKVSE